MRTLLLLVAVTGCASGARYVDPNPSPVPATVYVRSRFDAAWSAAVQFFADTRVPIGTIEKASGLIASKDFALDLAGLRHWADCGTVNGQPYVDIIDQGFMTGVADFNVFVQPAGDSTAIRVNVGVRSRLNPRYAATFGDRDICESNGVFEREVVEYIRLNAKP